MSLIRPRQRRANAAPTPRQRRANAAPDHVPALPTEALKVPIAPIFRPFRAFRATYSVISIINRG